MNKEFQGILFAYISKKEILKKHPDWLYKVYKHYFIKPEYYDILKKLIANKIYQEAKARRYILEDQIAWKETENYFWGFVNAKPTIILGAWKKLRPPSLTPEQFKEKVKKIIEKFEFEMVTPEMIEEEKIKEEIKKEKQKNEILRKTI